SLVPWPAPTLPLRSLGGACEQEPQEKAADQAADQADDHAQGEPAFGGSSKISGTHGAHASTPEPRHVRREGPPLPVADHASPVGSEDELVPSTAPRRGDAAPGPQALPPGGRQGGGGARRQGPVRRRH